MKERGREEGKGAIASTGLFCKIFALRRLARCYVLGAVMLLDGNAPLGSVTLKAQQYHYAEHFTATH